MIRFLLLPILALLITACGGSSGTEVTSSEAQAATSTEPVTATYNVDAAASTVNWEGTKLIGGGHTGILPITNGTMEINGDKLVGGKFTFDVAKLENTDLTEEDGKAKLEGHLRSADFFDVEAHPTATFEITNVSPAPTNSDDYNHDITGNLTIKGMPRSITIPAHITINEDRVEATTPDFVIDRTEWGIEYNSGSLDGMAKDKIINDEIGLKLDLVAMK